MSLPLGTSSRRPQQSRPAVTEDMTSVRSLLSALFLQINREFHSSGLLQYQPAHRRNSVLATQVRRFPRVAGHGECWCCTARSHLKSVKESVELRIPGRHGSVLDQCWCWPNVVARAACCGEQRIRTIHNYGTRGRRSNCGPALPRSVPFLQLPSQNHFALLPVKKCGKRTGLLRVSWSPIEPS